MQALKVHVLDVGQAASVVIDFGRDRYGIVDCGGATRDDGSALARFFREARAKSASMRILFMLITHLDLDHVNAIGALISDSDMEGRIERLYCNQLAYRRLLQVVKAAVRPKMGICSNPANRGVLRALRYLGELVQRRSEVNKDFHGECVAPEGSDTTRYPVECRVPTLGGDVKLEMWAPSQRLRDQCEANIGRSPAQVLQAVFGNREVEDWNTASVVLTLRAGGRCILIAGDATSVTWQELFERAEDKWVGADVVVAWHHGGRLGSRDGVDYDALVWDKVLSRNGKIVCVSCGSQNRYGHPHPETVKAVRIRDGQLYCTERNTRAGCTGRSTVRDDHFTMLLRAIAKSDLRLDNEDDGRCCGDIIVSVAVSGELTVSCASSECTERLAREGCCAASVASI